MLILCVTIASIAILLAADRLANLRIRHYHIVTLVCPHDAETLTTATDLHRIFNASR